MPGGVIGGICLLAFLLSKGRAEELESLRESEDSKDIEDIKQSVDLKNTSELETPGDLKNVISLAVTESNSQANEGRSGAPSEYGARSFGDSSVSQAVPQSNDDGSSSASAARRAQATPFNPFNEELGPFIPAGPSLSQAEAYNQEPNSALRFALSQLNGYRPDPAQTQAVNEPYQAIPILDPNPAPHDSSLVSYKDPSFSQAQTDNEAYQPFPIPKPSPKQLNSILSSLYSDRSDSASAIAPSNPYRFQKNPTQDEIEPYQLIPLPDPGRIAYGSSMVPFRDPNSEKVKVAPILYDPKAHTLLSPSYSNNIGRSREYNVTIDYIDSSPDLISKSGWNPYQYNPYPPGDSMPQYPSGAEAAPYADVKPATSGFANQYSLGISPYVTDYRPELPYRPGSFNRPEHEVQGTTNVLANAKSRTISSHEYVFPNKISGGENAIQCLKENEFHHFWSRGLDCLVCICLNDYGLLTPVCASCGGCHTPPPKLPEPFPQLPETITVQPATPEPFEIMPMMPEPLPSASLPETYPPMPQPQPYPPESNPLKPIREPNQPVPTPEPHPVYPETIPFQPLGSELFPEPVPTLTPPPAAASCNPLPSGQPFTNPLHPCQICICRESYVTGKPNVQIDCKENPQCIVPADVTTLPPLPDVSIPIPLPMCEKFPENVLFPHPTETCRLCKCSKSLSENGLPEEQITCYPHPDCVPKEEPVTEPVPPLPFLVDPHQVKPSPEPESAPVEPLKELFQPMEPEPLPEIVTVEPLPWPPITTVAPVSALPALIPRPGPLPGPSPHESCRPYPPNQPFQHPWDECQICLCSEAIAVGMITVEVNCHTKSSCCIEPPESVKTGFNLPYPGLANAVNIPDSQALPSGQSGAITSTYRPLPAYPSYGPRSVKIYPGGNPAIATDALNQPQRYPQPYHPIQTDTGYVDPSASYPYQSHYHPPPFVNPHYPEYPPRLPTPANAIGPYKSNHFGYPRNYQYGQAHALENAYPGPQGHFQPYDPRLQAVPAPSMYAPMYQKLNYQMPLTYPGQVREGYTQSQTSAQAGSSVQNLAQSYPRIGLAKSGNVDEPEDSVESQ